MIDIDSKSGADPSEILVEYDLAARPVVLTGEAPEGTPLSGVRGAHVYCAPGPRTGPTERPGVEVRGNGAYVMLPGSRHLSGVAYEWRNGGRPWSADLLPVPASLVPSREGKRVTAPRDRGARVPHGERHTHLKEFAVRLVRAGVTNERAILAHLWTHFHETCEPEPPPKPGDLEKLAAWAVSSDIAERERERQDHEKPPSESRRPTTRASGLSKRRLRWLWTGRLALGYLAVWCGAGDIGKSMFSAWVMGRLSHGELSGKFLGRPTSSLIVCTEDGRDDMWLPRLEAASADLDRIEFLDYPKGWNLRDGVDWIDRSLTDDMKLVFIDALMSHMPEPRGSENTRSPVFVREALEPLAALCKERKATGLFGLHPRKAGGDTFADVVQESGAFTQVPRIGLLFGYHPDDLELPRDQQRRVILRGKGNVGREPGALSFRIAEKFLDWDDDEPADPFEDGVPYATGIEPCHMTERQLLRAKLSDRPMSKVEQAEALIRMALLDGEWHPVVPIREELAKAGLNHNANVDAAKRRAGVVASKQAGVTNGPWGWQIAGSSISSPNPDSSIPARATLDPTLTLDLENPPNPNEYKKSQRVRGSERTTFQGAEESRVREAPRTRAPARGESEVRRPGRRDLRGPHQRGVPMTAPVAAIALAVARAGGDVDDARDLAAAWERMERDWEPRVDRIRYEAARPRCCCADEPVLGEDGRCSRCYGYRDGAA